MRLLTFIIMAGLLVTTAPGISDAQQSATAVVNPTTGTEMTTYYMVLLRRGPAWTATVTPVFTHFNPVSPEMTISLSGACAETEAIKKIKARSVAAVNGADLYRTSDINLIFFSILRNLVIWEDFEGGFPDKEPFYSITYTDASVTF